MPQHEHSFHSGNPLAEKNTLRVVILTAVMMVIEILAGWYYNSMALLADGWHMSSHAAALGISALAYAWSRRLHQDQRFCFGTWKIEILGGYTSAVLLAVVAVFMAYESVWRILQPRPIQFDQAILVAAIGLLVNLISAKMLHSSHDHGHHHPQVHHREHHDHEHEHDPHEHEHDHDEHHDLNLRSAYLHVLADAATSVMALVALLIGRSYGVLWLDPVMGIVGSGLVASWAKGLLIDSGRTLLDAEMGRPAAKKLKAKIYELLPDAQLHDLHLWRVSRQGYACIAQLDSPISGSELRQRLQDLPQLVYLTLEVTPTTAVSSLRS